MTIVIAEGRIGADVVGEVERVAELLKKAIDQRFDFRTQLFGSLDLPPALGVPLRVPYWRYRVAARISGFDNSTTADTVSAAP